MKDKSCKGCDSMCCKYVVTEIDVPENKEDFENIKWFVCHKDVYVFVDDEDKWYLEFITPCEYLDIDGWCKIYEKRPKICREYDHEECLFHNENYEEKYRFEKISDVENYLKNVFDKELHIIPKEEIERDEENEDDEDEKEEIEEDKEELDDNDEEEKKEDLGYKRLKKDNYLNKN